VGLNTPLATLFIHVFLCYTFPELIQKMPANLLDSTMSVFDLLAKMKKGYNDVEWAVLGDDCEVDSIEILNDLGFRRLNAETSVFQLYKKEK
jgi:hypothetical protein